MEYYYCTRNFCWISRNKDFLNFILKNKEFESVNSWIEFFIVKKKLNLSRIFLKKEYSIKAITFCKFNKFLALYITLVVLHSFMHDSQVSNLIFCITIDMIQFGDNEKYTQLNKNICTCEIKLKVINFFHMVKINFMFMYTFMFTKVC